MRGCGGDQVPECLIPCYGEDILAAVGGVACHDDPAVGLHGCTTSAGTAAANVGGHDAGAMKARIEAEVCIVPHQREVI